MQCIFAAFIRDCRRYIVLWKDGFESMLRNRMKQLTLRGVGGKMLIMMVLRQCLGFALKQDRNNCKRQS